MVNIRSLLALSPLKANNRNVATMANRSLRDEQPNEVVWRYRRKSARLSFIIVSKTVDLFNLAST